jgi:hypothetical protein
MGLDGQRPKAFDLSSGVLMVLKPKKEKDSTVEYVGIASLVVVVGGLFWWLSRLLSRRERNKGSPREPG